MAHIIIKDLEQNQELTSKALASISGGMYTAPQGELLSNLCQPFGGQGWNPSAPYNPCAPYQPINLTTYQKFGFYYESYTNLSTGGHGPYIPYASVA